MATFGHLVVAPDKRCATWTLALADLKGKATDVGLQSEEFFLLGHTWTLQVYMDTSSSTAANSDAPCSILVQSKERGSVQGNVTLDGIPQSLDYYFGSGARAILRWPALGSNVSASSSLEVVLQISSVGEEATCRAAGEISLVQQLEQLKAEKQELQGRVAALSDELGGVKEELVVTEKGRLFSLATAKKFVHFTKALELRLAQHISDPYLFDKLKGENVRIASEKMKLQEDFRDLLDDHETLAKRFKLAQELKAKSEVLAYNAETQLDAERADRQSMIDGVVVKQTELEAELQAKINAVEAERASWESEGAKLRSQVNSLSDEKRTFDQQFKLLEAQRDEAVKKSRSAETQQDVYMYRLRERDEELKKIKEDPEMLKKIKEEQQAKKKKGLIKQQA